MGRTVRDSSHSATPKQEHRAAAPARATDEIAPAPRPVGSQRARPGDCLSPAETPRNSTSLPPLQLPPVRNQWPPAPRLFFPAVRTPAPKAQKNAPEALQAP